MTASLSLADSYEVRGRVLTMARDADREASRFGVRGNVITSSPVDSEVFDFGNRVVLPGFVDGHTHAASSFTAMAKVDCRAPSHATVSDVLDELRDAVRDRGEGDWIVAQANLFFDQKLADRRYPSLKEMDSVSRTTPIIVQAGGHVSVLNSKAMEIARVGRFKTGDDGASGSAVVELDDAGNPTGVVSEIDAYLSLPEPTVAELGDLTERGIRELFTRYGVTTLGEISHSRESVSTLAANVTRGRHLRVQTYLWAPHTLSLDEACCWRDHLDVDLGEFFEIRGVKLFCDGGYSAHNAATLTPYVAEFAVGEGSCGQLAMTRETVASALEKINAAGLQMVVHSNGERAQRELATGTRDVLDRVGSLAFPVRSEHAGNLLSDKGTMQFWADGDLVPVSQPTFLYNFGDFVPRLLGEPARHGQFAWRTMLEAGWSVAGGSDHLHGSEERQSNPLFGVWCCVARKSYLGDVVEPDQKLTVEEALRVHTVNTADAMGLPDRGSLEHGKLADFVVLAEDPRAVPVDHIPDIAVDFVVVGGKVVHERPGATPPQRGIGGNL